MTRKLLENGKEKMNEKLRSLCGKALPVKRFAAVLIVAIALSIGFFYILATSLYNLGKHDAEKDFLELKHIETLKLK